MALSFTSNVHKQFTFVNQISKALRTLRTLFQLQQLRDDSQKSTWFRSLAMSTSDFLCCSATSVSSDNIRSISTVANDDDTSDKPVPRLYGDGRLTECSNGGLMRGIREPADRVKGTAGVLCATATTGSMLLMVTGSGLVLNSRSVSDLSSTEVGSGLVPRSQVSTVICEDCGKVVLMLHRSICSFSSCTICPTKTIVMFQNCKISNQFQLINAGKFRNNCFSPHCLKCAFSYSQSAEFVSVYVL